MLKKISVITTTMILLFSLILLPIRANASVSPVDLATASTFGILANTTITNTGTSSVEGSAGGDIGIHAGTSITGLSTLTISGTIHTADAVALLAKNDLSKAYDDAAGRVPFITIPTELGGSTLVPGVYTSASGTFGVTGTLTLDGQNDIDAVFIFQMAATLITASSSKIIMTNGARVCNVFWQVGSSATLGTDSTFIGHIMASASIAANTGANIYGSLHAKTGAVTLQGNKITNIACETLPTNPPTNPPVTTNPPVSPPTTTNPVTNPPVTSPTEKGGLLPNTGSNIYEIPLLGTLLILIGIIGLRFRKKHE